MPEPKIIDAAALALFREMDEKYKRALEREREASRAYLQSPSPETRKAGEEALRDLLRIERERWELHEQYFVVTWEEEPDVPQLEKHVEPERGLTPDNIAGIQRARAAYEGAQEAVNKAIKGNAPKEELSKAFKTLQETAKTLREYQELTRGKRLTEPIDVSAGKLWIENKVRALAAPLGLDLLLEWGEHTGDKWEYTLRATSDTARFAIIKFSLEQLSDVPFARETKDLEKRLADFVSYFRS